MAFGFVASTKFAGAANGGTTPGIVSTGANLAIQYVLHDTSSDATAPTDFYGNTYTPLTEYDDTGAPAGLFGRLWYNQGGTVGSGHTASIAITGKFPGTYFAVYSGAASSPFDQQNGAGETDATVSMQPGSITPTQDNELIVTGMANVGTIASETGAGFTTREANAFAGGGNYGGAIADKIQTTAGAVNPNWAWPSNTLNSKTNAQASFRAAAAGGSGGGRLTRGGALTNSSLIGGRLAA